MKRVITYLEEKLHEEMVQLNKLNKFKEELVKSGYTSTARPEADKEMIAQLERAIHVLKHNDRIDKIFCSAGEWVPATDIPY